MKNGGMLIVRSLLSVALCGLGSMPQGCSSEAGAPVVLDPGRCLDCKVPEPPPPAPADPTFVSSSFPIANGVPGQNFVAGRIGLADFNGDGNVDIASSGTSRFGVLLGDGTGSFRMTANLPNVPQGLAIADFNLDGKPDLVNPGLRLGDGAGSFVSGTYSIPGYPFPLSVASGDLNLDGKPDFLLGSESHTVSLLLGDGAGGFMRTSMTDWGDIRCPLIRDVNRDGKPDLILPYYNSATLNISLGDGSGVFPKPTQIATDRILRGVDVAAADFDSNGDLDLVLTTTSGSVILLGDGKGGFTQSASLSLGAMEAGVAAGDLNADGKPDVVITDQSTNTVSVFFNDGTGLRYRDMGLPAAAKIKGVAIGDLDRDGRPDIAASADGGVLVFLNRP